MTYGWNHHNMFGSKVARAHHIDMMRMRMLARWSFKPFDVVIIPWCGACGSANHHVVIVSIRHLPGRSEAVVMPVAPCHRTTLSLGFARPFGGPFTDDMLKVRHRVIKEHKEKHGNTDPYAAVDCG